MPTNNNAHQRHNIYAWLVFLLSAGFLFYKYILQVSPAVMTDDFMRAFDLSGTGLGILVGFYFYTYMIMQIPSGIILDKFGPHKPTTFAIFICAVGAALLAYTNHYTLACTARLLMGFGAAFATTSYMKLASQWFAPRFFPLLSGLFGTACMLGAGTAEAPMAQLVHGVGWRNTLLVVCLAGIVLLIVFYWVANPIHDEDPDKFRHNTPFQWSLVKSILKQRSNLPLILYGGLAFTPATVFGGLWGVPFLQTAYHVNKTTAASSISLIFFGFALGGIIVGFIGKSSRQLVPIMTIGTTLATLFLCAVIYLPGMPYWGINVCLSLYGVFSAGFLMSYTVAKNINISTIVGTVIGVFNMGDPLCGAIADPLVGKVLDLNWHGDMINGARVFDIHAYHVALSLVIVYLLLAIFCSFFIRENQTSFASHPANR